MSPSDERISAEVSRQVGVAAGTGIDFVPIDDVRAAVKEAGVDEATADALVDDYAQAQIQSLKTGLLVAALLALFSLPFTRDLPKGSPRSEGQAEKKEGAAAT